MTEHSPRSDRRYHNPVQHETMTYLVTAGESDGRLTRIAFELAPGPGGGPAPHRHIAYDEHFAVVDGTLRLRVDDDVTDLHAGQSATAPKGRVHAFSNPTSAPVSFVAEVRPGHVGLERLLLVLFGLARDGLVARSGLPRNPLHLALLAEWGQARATGPASLAGPALGLLARYARHRGIDLLLEERYVDIPSVRSDAGAAAQAISPR